MPVRRFARDGTAATDAGGGKLTRLGALVDHAEFERRQACALPSFGLNRPVASGVLSSGSGQP